MSKPPPFRPLISRIDALEPRMMLTGSATDAPAIGHPTVLSLDPTSRLPDLHRITGVEVAHQANLRGAGQTVVVIDSGVAYDHPALGGGFGPQHQVVGGWDFTEENDNDPYDDGPAGYHGTHVAGIVAGQDPRHLGVAPEADIVALRVFNDYGRGKLSWLESSLQWVIENQNAFENPITTVSMSIGTSWHAMGLPDYATLEDELQALRDANIFVAVAAGNRFDADDPQANHLGLSYPAASPFVVPATSADSKGQLSDFSQRTTNALAVPGESVISTVPDFLEDFNGKTDDYYAASGTSMAAPYLAGASMLVRQAMQQTGVQNITVDAIYDVLLETAERKLDPATNLFYHHVHVGRAINTVLNSSPFQVQGDQLLVFGTAGDDLIHLDSRGFVRVNGQRFSFAIDQFSTFTVAGNDGNDRLTISVNHPDANVQDSFLFRPYEVTWNSQSYNLDARDFERIDVLANTDTLSATFEGGNDRDRLVIQPHRSWMQSGQSINYVYGASRVTGVANDARDTVTLYDGPGDDRAQISAEGARMEAGDFTAIARGYSSYTLRATGGGRDTVELVGTPGNDTVRAKPEYVTLHSPQHSVYAQLFEVRHVSGQGGRDQARLYGSPQADRLITSVQVDQLWTPTTRTDLDNFTRVDVQAGGGSDAVHYAGSQQQDAFVAGPGYSSAILNGSLRTTAGFESTTIDAGAGEDSIWLYDSAGNDQFQLSTKEILASGPDIQFSVREVEFVHATSRSGDDQATLILDQVADRILSDDDMVTWQHAMGMIIAEGFTETAIQDTKVDTRLSAAMEVLLDEFDTFPS